MVAAFRRTAMRVGALWSGGKDSTYAAWLSTKKEKLECLITVFPKSEESYMFHFPNLRWTGLQAEAIGVPQVIGQTAGIKEKELEDLERTLFEAKSKFTLEGIYTGALASVYQKTRVERICMRLGLDCISPLWGVNPENHLRRLLSDGFDTIIVGVSALGLDQKWLGRSLDDKAIDELVSLSRKYRFHAGLEGGEGETFVLDCPLFKKRVEIEDSVTHWRADAGYLEITKARLISKGSRKA